MAKRYQLREIERMGGDLHKIIPLLVNQGGQKGAADTLCVTQATISRWLKMNGYRKVQRYERTA